MVNRQAGQEVSRFVCVQVRHIDKVEPLSHAIRPACSIHAILPTVFIIDASPNQLSTHFHRAILAYNKVS